MAVANPSQRPSADFLCGATMFLARAVEPRMLSHPLRSLPAPLP